MTVRLTIEWEKLCRKKAHRIATAFKCVVCVSVCQEAQSGFSCLYTSLRRVYNPLKIAGEKAIIFVRLMLQVLPICAACMCTIEHH